MQFFKYATFAHNRSLSSRRPRVGSSVTVSGDAGRYRFGFIARLLCCLLSGSATSEHDLIGIADVVDRSDLTAQELFTVLTKQHLQLELRTVDAALGPQAFEAIQPVVT